MKISFPRCVNRHSKINVAMPIPSRRLSFEKELFMNMYIYTNMKSSFPKRVKRQLKKWASNVNPKFVDYM